MKTIYVVESLRQGKRRWYLYDHVYTNIKEAKVHVGICQRADLLFHGKCKYRIRRGKLDDAKHAINF